MKQKTLLILAAGMGSRFGGLKQIEPIDDSGNFIIDYSIFDALRAGFDKVVFVIKKENLDIFKTTVGKRIEKHIKVEYVFQSLNDFVDKVPKDRQKPWGTAHAVLCAKDKISGDFVMLNADDLYGKEAFEVAAHFIEKNNDFKTYGLVAYKTKNTLSLNGEVKRGVCSEKNGLLKKIVECVISLKDNKIIANVLAKKDTSFELEEDSLVSMNMMCLNSKFFKYLEKDFKRFIKNCDTQKDECLIQDVMYNQTVEEKAKIMVLKTQAVWKGVTYQKDLPDVKNFVLEKIKKGRYPKNLWKA